MSTLFVNNLNTASGTTITVPTGKTLVGTDTGSITAPGMVLQVQYTTHPNDQNVSNISSQASLNVNNAITRGTCSTSFTRKDANSFFLVECGFTAYRPTTSGELRIGYRLNVGGSTGSDVLAYVQDNVNWVASQKHFKDTTSGSAGDTVEFQSVYQNTAATTNAIRHVYMNVLEIAQ